MRGLGLTGAARVVRALISDDLPDLVLGSRCVGCDRPGRALCAVCGLSLAGPARVSAPTPSPPDLPLVWATAGYGGVVRAALIAHKERGRVTLAAPLGAALALAIESAAMTPSPAATAAPVTSGPGAASASGTPAAPAPDAAGSAGHVPAPGAPGTTGSARAVEAAATTEAMTAPDSRPAPAAGDASAGPAGHAPAPGAPGTTASTPPTDVRATAEAMTAPDSRPAPAPAAGDASAGPAGRVPAPGAPGATASTPPMDVRATAEAMTAPDSRPAPAAGDASAGPAGHVHAPGAPGATASTPPTDVRATADALRTAAVERATATAIPAGAAHSASAARAPQAHAAASGVSLAGAGELLIVPVPSARRAVRERGYDPLLAIARQAVRRLRRSGHKVRLVRPLKLNRRVADQTELGAAERMANLAGAFTVPPRHRAAIAGRTVVLVDDLMTTGATLHAVAAALRAAGARVPAAAVVAATARDSAR